MVRSCLHITLIQCLGGHIFTRLWGSLNIKSKSTQTESVSHLMSCSGHLKLMKLTILSQGSSSGTVTEQPTSGVLTSPNYPELYPDPIELVQTIEVPVGNTIWIRFTDLQTDNHTGGQHFDRENIVQLSNPRQPVHLMNWHSEFLSDTNKVEVQFQRIEGFRAACWRLEWGESQK